MELGGSSVEGESRRRWRYIGGGHYFLTADKRAGISAGGRNMGAGLGYNAGCQGEQADRLGAQEDRPCLPNGSGGS